MKKILVAFIALAIAIAPVIAEARAGSSFSGGSRSSSSFSSSRSSSYSAPRSTYSYSNSSVGSKGSNTYTPSPTYKPITNSVTPRPALTPAPTQSYAGVSRTPAYVAPAPVYHPAYSAPAPVYHSGGGFGSSFMGGFAGSALGSMMFGNHNNGGTTIVNNGGGVPMAGGVAGAPVAGGEVVYGGQPTTSSYGIMSFLGDMLAIILFIAFIWLIIWAIMKFINRSSNVNTVGETNGDVYAHTHAENNYLHIQGASVTRQDKDSFKTILIDIQNAWSNRDKSSIKKNTTDEMYEFFCDTLDHNTEEGIINKVANVHGVECDVLEVWEEHGTKYATAILRWSAHDFTTDLKGKVLDHGTYGYVRETWTFVENSYGLWVLSAVQQMED